MLISIRSDHVRTLYIYSPPKKPHHRPALDDSGLLYPLRWRIARVLQHFHELTIVEIDRLAFSALLFEGALYDLDAIREFGCGEHRNEGGHYVVFCM